MNRRDRFLILLTAFLLPITSFSQGTWTWVSGDSLIATGGTPNTTYGSKGVPSPTSTPPHLYEACEWTDHHGNFWLYGGDGPWETNDLWKYDPTTNMWTWMHGSGVDVDGIGHSTRPVYGTKGIPAPLNTPGSRAWGIMTWVDKNGDLWLFGGDTQAPAITYSTSNDLWKYTIASNEWTWMRGDSSENFNSKGAGHYGTKGIAHPANDPPVRQENNLTWTDKDGNLWLYGGLGGPGTLDDLWKYDPSINMWTWMSGHSIPGNYPPVYGIKGVEDPLNTPGKRLGYAKFQDGDKLYLFGAAKLLNLGGVIGSDSLYNDVWSYNIATGYWTWVSGTNEMNDNGKYDSICKKDTSFIPRAKFEQRSSWSNGSCGFWIFGGGIKNIGHSNNGCYNDLWYFNLETLQWSLMSGDSLPLNQGKYGVKGTASTNNIPRARDGAVPFKGKDGSLWLFGGVAFSSFSPIPNDLWHFMPDTSCVKLCTDLITFPPEPEIGTELLIPNVFTPNGDAENNLFKITAKGYKAYVLKIYSRWGTPLMFQSDDASVHWDGMISTSGNPASDGVYYYILELTDQKNIFTKYTGFLTLIR